MARPKKQEHERRDTALPPVRVTMAEWLHVEEQAAKAGLSLSEYQRRRCLGYVVDVPPSKTDQRLVYELNRAGVNLHQLVKHLNFGGTLSGEAEQVLTKLDAILDQIVAAYDS